MENVTLILPLTCTVDVGEEKPRNVCSGLVMHVPIEEMQERMAIFLCNLKTSKLVYIYSTLLFTCSC